MISKTEIKIGFLEFAEIKRYRIKSSEQILLSVYKIYDKKITSKKFTLK